MLLGQFSIKAHDYALRKPSEVGADIKLEAGVSAVHPHRVEFDPTLQVQGRTRGIVAMIGRNAAVAEVGKHRHQVEGPLAFAAWLGAHAMLLSGTHSKTDAFPAWAWDYFDGDHWATVEASSASRRIAWGGDDEDVPHISLERPKSADTHA